jgi:hypothetical protein
LSEWSLKPSCFLTKIYIVTESLNLLIFRLLRRIYPYSKGFSSAIKNFRCVKELIYLKGNKEFKV